MNPTAVITFATPLALLGLIALAGPWFAHRLTRQTGRRVVFPTVDLLTAAQGGARQVHRLRRRVLMLVRLLIVALLVLAFAQPQYVSSGAVAAGAPRLLVLILDSSASMQQVRDGGPVSDDARAAALRAAAGLRDGLDQVALIVAGAEADVQPPRTADAAWLRDALLSWRPVDQHADAHRALAEAHLLAREHDGPSQLVLITDGQSAAQWQEAIAAAQDQDADEGTDEAAGEGAASRGSQPPLVVVPLVKSGDANIAITSAGVEPAAPAPGAPATLQVTVKHFAGERTASGGTRGHAGRARGDEGDDASSDAALVHMQVEIDGRRADEATVQIPAGESRALQLPWRFEAPGAHSVRYVLRAPEEFNALPADDARAMVVQVAPPQRVLLIARNDQAIGALAQASAQASAQLSAQLLATALAPIETDLSGLALQRTTPEDARAKLNASAAPDVVVLPTLADVSPELAGALHGFVDRGGGMLVFVGPGSEAAIHLPPTTARESLARLLPWLPEDVQTSAQEVVAFDHASTQAGPFAGWGPEAEYVLRRLVVHRRYAADQVSPAARIWLSYAPSDTDSAASADAGPDAAADAVGDAAATATATATAASPAPFAASRAVGRGRVLMINASPDPQWSTLASHVLFPSLVRSSVDWLGERAATSTSSPAGQPLVIRTMRDVASSGAAPDPQGQNAGGAASADVTGPGGESVAWRWTHDDRGSAAVVDNAQRAGVYRLIIDAAPAGAAAAHVPPEESDLAAGGFDATVLAAGSSVSGASSASRMSGASSMSGVSSAIIADDVAAVDDVVHRPEPLPLWPWCLAAAALLLAVECVMIYSDAEALLTRVRHRLFGRPAAPPVHDVTLRPARSRANAVDDEAANNEAADDEAARDAEVLT